MPLSTETITNQGTLLLTNISQTNILSRLWIHNYIHIKMWDVITKPRPNLRGSSVKVAEDDIAFKLAILKKSLHLNDNTCFCSIIISSKLVLGSLLAKNNFFVQF